MKVSEHFDRSEFECSCGCGFATVDIELLKVLEVVRKKFNSPITITSACRCPEYNSEIGGAYGSKHKQGIAADIVVKDVSPDEVYRFIDAHMPRKGGLGMYSKFTHVDVRQKKSRWNRN